MHKPERSFEMVKLVGGRTGYLLFVAWWVFMDMDGMVCALLYCACDGSHR